MNKLVYGIGVNDLGYRTQVYEDVTKMEAKESGRLFFYANTMQRGKTCYEDVTAKNTWKATQPISARACVTSGCPLQHLNSGWRNKTGVVSA